VRDYLGRGAWWNRPVRNPIQTLAKRFVRQPGSGLPDFLEDTQTRFKEFGSESLKTRFSDMMKEGST
jgi:hypothetical protein